MKFLKLKYSFSFYGLFLTILACSFLSCNKDDDNDFVAKKTNYITFSPLSKTVKVDATAPPTSLTLTADIKEFSGLEISKIDLYFISNSNEYVKRVAESVAFNPKASGSYFNNKLNINYLGEKTSPDFVEPFSQYIATINVPLDKYPPVIDDYFYAGIEFTYLDGTTYKGTCRVDYVKQ